MAEPYTQQERETICRWATDSHMLIHKDFLRYEATCQALEAEIAKLKAQLAEYKWRTEAKICSTEEPDYNALAAERIMEWHLGPKMGIGSAWYSSSGTLEMPRDDWDPMHNIAQADMVRKAVEAKGWQLMISSIDHDGKVFARLYKKGLFVHEIIEETWPAAIVKISLRAVGAIE